MKYVSLTALVIVFAAPRFADAEKHDHQESDMVRIDNASKPAMSYQLMRTSGSGNSINVYLNPNGALIRGGWENSARGSSGLVARRGYRSVNVPRYRGSRASFQRIVQCVKSRYAQFNINIQTERPRSGRYIMAMIGGGAHTLGYRGNIAGVAPFNGRIIDNAVVFVFDRNWRSLAAMCNTVVHEIGHALGLEHQYLCKDPMSYLRGCGTKTFQNVDAWCGEYRARRCRRGRTQNTYKTLARNLGLRSRQPQTEPDPDTDPGVEPEPPITRRPPTRRPQPPITRRPRYDGNAPNVKILSARKGSTNADGVTHLTIKVWAKDRGGVSKVQLGWITPQRRFVFDCDRMPSNMPVTCSKSGNYYTFRLKVGYGQRGYAVRVVDRAGNSTVTNTTSLSFDQAAVPARPRWQRPRNPSPQRPQPRYPEPDYDDDEDDDDSDYEQNKTSGCSQH